MLTADNPDDLEQALRIFSVSDLCMIKDAIANIARNREVLHFLSCIARFLGHFSGLATIRPSGFRDPAAFTVTNPARSPRTRLRDNPWGGALAYRPLLRITYGTTISRQQSEPLEKPSRSRSSRHALSRRIEVSSLESGSTLVALRPGWRAASNPLPGSLRLWFVPA
jgi:hypothetical protein